jgi:hypothetical protein
VHSSLFRPSIIINTLLGLTAVGKVLRSLGALSNAEQIFMNWVHSFEAYGNGYRHKGAGLNCAKGSAELLEYDLS